MPTLAALMAAPTWPHVKRVWLSVTSAECVSVVVGKSSAKREALSTSRRPAALSVKVGRAPARSSTYLPFTQFRYSSAFCTSRLWSIAMARA